MSDQGKEGVHPDYWIAIDQIVEIKRLHARIEALETALRQEPIAWRERDGDEWIYHDCEYVEARHLDKDMLEPLYARAALTEGQDK